MWVCCGEVSFGNEPWCRVEFEWEWEERGEGG